MSEVKRYRVPTLPGRLTRDCPEVVEACDYDALLEVLGKLYDHVEDGPECYENPEAQEGYIGRAVWLPETLENEILALLPKNRTAGSAAVDSGTESLSTKGDER